MIKLIRIDYRMIHGQVVFTWANNLSLDRVVVIDDKTAEDPAQKMTLSLSVPSGVKFNLFTLKDALARKNKLANIPDSTAIIFQNVETCYKFMKEFNGNVKEINYGGIPKRENTKEFDKAVFLTPSEIEQTNELIKLGYKVYSRQTPTSDRKDFKDLH